MIPRISLCMIVKGTSDEAPLLDRCLKSVAKHVDGIFIDVNAPKGKKPSKKVLDVAKKYTKNVRETVWAGNFVQARNDNFDQVPKEYTHLLWLDSDDTVENPEKIREVAAVMPSEVDGVYIRYDYEHDDYGNVTVGLDVARLVRNNGTFRWKSSFDDAEVAVHETLNEVRSVGKGVNKEFKIVHHSDNQRKDASLERNIRLLEGMYERSKDNPDPRILFYLATHYYDAGFIDATKEILERYLTMSGWAEERAQAWVYLGDIYKLDGHTTTARGCYVRAMAENPKDPIPYVELGELDMSDQLWEKAIEWLETAASKKVDHTSAVLRPLEGTYRAYKALAQCNVQLGGAGIEKAAEWVAKAIKLRPTDPELLEAKELVEHLQKTVKLNESVMRLVGELREKKENDRIIPLLDSLPSSLQESPTTVSIRRYYSKPKTWPENSIAIVCGTSALGHWGPWSLEEGIGGSEEAVIQLSKELTALGYSVTVYATPGTKAGEYDGVNWRHYWEFNPKDQFDVLVGWRMPHIFDAKLKARKKYLWLHDVIDAPELTKERLDNLDKVIFVSQYHADLYPDVPKEKKFASGNGIDPAQFEVEAIERNPKKVVYMSAHERGQDLLQRIWPDVLKEVPDAEAHCYYGWAGYDHINKDNPERMAWKAQLIEQQKSLKKFTDHGKIGHKDIVKEIFSAGVWAYPTGFDEVYCHPAGTKVMTEFGEKNIEELLLTDKVLTHRGVLKPIYQTMRRKADKLIKLSVRSGDDLLLTPNHPVYTRREGKYVWVEASELTENDVLLTPAELLDTDYSWVNQGIFYINDGRHYRTNNLPTKKNRLPDKIELNPKLARFFGYFAGDGNANERGKVSVLVADSHPEHDQIVLDGFKELGFTPDVAKKRGCSEYRIYSYELARAFRRYFYDGKKKKLPLAWAAFPEVMDGLMAADGCCYKGYNFKFTNTSERLIGWMKIALAIKGYSGKACERTHKNGNKSWTISWTQEGKIPQYTKQGYPLQFIEKKIKSIDTVEHNDWVYNIEVKDDHSYVSNGLVVHNCITAVKAQAGGAWPVYSNHAALKDAVQFGDKVEIESKKINGHDVGIWTEEKLEEFKQKLIHRLKNPATEQERQEMMTWARENMSWKNTAKGWHDEFSS